MIRRALALLVATLTACSSAAAADMSVYGFEIGKPLALPSSYGHQWL